MINDKEIYKLFDKLYMDIVQNNLEDFTQESIDLLETVLSCHIPFNNTSILNFLILLSVFYIEDETLLNLLQEIRQKIAISYYNKIYNGIDNDNSPVSMYAEQLFN